ncbi:MAG: DUF1015 domain-containing protein [Bacteroidia bacterium]
MVRVYPFAALRPTQEFVSQVASRTQSSSDTVSLQQELDSNALSYLHVIKSGISEKNPESSHRGHYDLAIQYFEGLKTSGVLIHEESPAIYIYSQKFPDNHIFEGLILGISAIDYLEGSIKKHEYTLTEKESRMVEHVTQTGVVGEPVLIANPNSAYTKDWIRRHRKGDPVLVFTDKDNIEHSVWAEKSKEAIAEIQLAFREIDSLYIADGHHRIAASSMYLTHMHNEKNWKAEQLCFMAYVLADTDLWIKPFHRLVKGFTEQEVQSMIDGLQDRFEVEFSKDPVIPAAKGTFGLYSRGGWLRLQFKEEAAYHTPAENLDVSRLEQYIFKSLLSIEDSKSDNRLGFLRGDVATQELEQLIQDGIFDLAFVLFANTMQEIQEVADAGQTMPPKSTWIEPKLLTGMLIQEF